jgi:hypothetical protein
MEVRKQIGNAIPPNVWKHFIKSCLDTLEKFDTGMIDETGRPPWQQTAETGRIASQVGASSSSEKGSSIRSARTSTFSTYRTPSSTRKNLASSVINTPTSSASASSSQSSSSSSMSTYLLSPRLASSRAWSEESRTLSLEPSPLRSQPSTYKLKQIPLKRELPLCNRPSPFKRKLETIDLTEDEKDMNMRDCIDLTEEDDYVMVDS